MCASHSSSLPLFHLTYSIKRTSFQQDTPNAQPAPSSCVHAFALAVLSRRTCYGFPYAFRCPLFLHQFKGLLSHSSSKPECSPTVASANRNSRTFPKESRTKATEVPAQAVGGGDLDAAPSAGSSIPAAVSPGERKRQEKKGAEGKGEEGKAVQVKRCSLSWLARVRCVYATFCTSPNFISRR